MPVHRVIGISEEHQMTTLQSTVGNVASDALLNEWHEQLEDYSSRMAIATSTTSRPLNAGRICPSIRLNASTHLELFGMRNQKRNSVIKKFFDHIFTNQ
jgi:hypothetical protein